MFGKEESCVGDKERTRAKVVCLGIIYGMGTPQVAKKLEVTESQVIIKCRAFIFSYVCTVRMCQQPAALSSCFYFPSEDGFYCCETRLTFGIALYES